MKNSKFRALVVVSITLASFLTVSCARESIKVDLPANHPANPRSPETAFIPPPNPFMNGMPMTENQTGSGSAMTHEKQQSAHRQHMSPDTDHVDHESKSSPVSETQGTEHHHKEHNK